MKASVIKYALSKTTGEPIYIEFASNGLSCNCECAGCGETMVAVQGKSERPREWHFRHSTDSSCSGAQETAIHKLAKKIIIENSTISIPGGTFTYSQGMQEVKIGAFITDVKVLGIDHEAHFEICVTHPVDKIKDAFYREKGLASIEINLQNISYDIKPADLQELILRKAKRRKIFWPTSNSRKGEEKNWLLLIIPAIAVLLFWKRNKGMSRKNRR